MARHVVPGERAPTRFPRHRIRASARHRRRYWHRHRGSRRAAVALHRPDDAV